MTSEASNVRLLLLKVKNLHRLDDFDERVTRRSLDAPNQQLVTRLTHKDGVREPHEALNSLRVSIKLVCQLVLAQVSDEDALGVSTRLLHFKGHTFVL